MIWFSQNTILRDLIVAMVMIGSRSRFCTVWLCDPLSLALKLWQVAEQCSFLLSDKCPEMFYIHLTFWKRSDRLIWFEPHPKCSSLTRRSVGIGCPFWMWDWIQLAEWKQMCNTIEVRTFTFYANSRHKEDWTLITPTLVYETLWLTFSQWKMNWQPHQHHTVLLSQWAPGMLYSM